MAAPKFSKAQRELVKGEIAIRYLRGERQADIAAVLDLSQPQISYYLEQLEAEWLESAQAGIDLARARELAKIDVLERTYWQAWEQSCQPGIRSMRSHQTKSADVTGRKAQALVKKLSAADSAAPAEALASGLKDGTLQARVVETVRRSQRTTITRLGNPAYLTGVQWCISTRCELLGFTNLPPQEEKPDAVPPSAIDAAAVAAAEAVLLRAYTGQRPGLVPELPADGNPPDQGRDPV